MKNPIIKMICLSLALLMLLSCASCGLTVSAETTELSENYKRTATETGEITDAFKTALADFSMNLFKGLVTKDGENDLVSPLSAVICLAMVANGAEGETKAQMEKAFGMDIDTLNKSLYAFTSSLYSAEDCKISIADSIWFRDGENKLQVNNAFLQANADWYNAQIYASPFDNDTLKDINNWCKKYTDGMIDKMLDQIDPNTVMYLANALVFDAKWAQQYEDDNVIDFDFINYDGSGKKVKMLSSGENTLLYGDNVVGFAKNYVGDRYSIIGLLPDEGTDVYDYIASLDGKAWMNLWNSRVTKPVHVLMPEFTYSTDMDLIGVLQSMGIKDLFCNKANLKKIADADLFCGKVSQKTFIKVDRNGTKAAAATIAGIELKSAIDMTNEVILDRPFVYAIADNRTGLPVFIGAVTTL